MDTLDKTRDLRRMKLAATGLLITMIALFAAATWFEHAYPVLGAARAFAEAGIAGGLADWFAITALFRHPLGLPLPHTAIIARNKDRIGRNLGSFFERNFLTQEVVAGKLESTDLAGAFLRWVGKPAQIDQIAGYLTALAPGLVAAAGDAHAVSDDGGNEDNAQESTDIAREVRNALAARLREIDLAPIATGVLDQLAQSIDYDAILLPALEEIAALVHDNEDVLRSRVRAQTAWIWQRVSLDEKVTGAMIRVLDGALDELRDAPDHPWRQRLAALAHERLAGMAATPAFLAKCEALRERFIESQAFGDGIAMLWRELGERLRADAASPDSFLRERLRAVIARWAHDALRDETLQTRLNERARDAILALVPAQRHELAELINDTVQRWDTATVTRKLELETGRDLQFVRINGTLIGGLVGLALYGIHALI